MAFYCLSFALNYRMCYFTRLLFHRLNRIIQENDFSTSNLALYNAVDVIILIVTNYVSRNVSTILLNLSLLLLQKLYLSLFCYSNVTCFKKHACFLC
jgi:hypothetical protein